MDDQKVMMLHTRPGLSIVEVGGAVAVDPVARVHCKDLMGVLHKADRHSYSCQILQVGWD
jgi:hypothetical protein